MLNILPRRCITVLDIEMLSCGKRYFRDLLGCFFLAFFTLELYIAGSYQLLLSMLFFSL